MQAAQGPNPTKAYMQPESVEAKLGLPSYRPIKAIFFSLA